jgi:hypothetical protein
MSTIVKSYTFLENITVDASEINRNFDDLFTTINDLNSENIAAGYTLGASNATLVDTGGHYSSTHVEGALAEPTYLQKGLQTIYIVPQGTNAIIVFPGKAEIDGQICVVSTRFTVSGMTMHDSGSPQYDLYFICGQPATGEEITASDIFLMNASNVTTSASYNDGYYYDSKRVLGGCFCLTSSCQNLLNGYNPDPPQKSFVYGIQNTADNVASRVFGITQTYGGVTSTNAFTINDITLFYDRDVGAYGYRTNLMPYSQTAQNNPLGSPQNTVNMDFSIYTQNSRTSFASSTSIQNYVGNHLAITVSEAVVGSNPHIYITARPLPYNVGHNA